MSEAVTINEDGALVIDMAKADALWRSLDPLKQAELTNIMFEPVLKKAKEQADRIEELEAKLAAIDDLMVRRIRHHQEMKGLGGSGMAMKREHYKLHVLSETLGEIRKVTKARTILAELKGQKDE